MFEFMTIRELYEIVLGGSHVEIDSIEYVQLQGWVRTNRSSGKIGFIELNDGTYFRNAQLVYSSDLKDFNEVEKYTTGSALTVMGKFVYTPQGKQPFEIQVKEIELEGADFGMVCHIIAVIGHGRMDGGEPEGCHSEAVDVIQLVNESVEVAVFVTVLVCKGVN